MKDFKEILENLKKRFDGIKKKTDFESLNKEIEKMQTKSTDKDFWKDQRKAQKHMARLGDLQRELNELLEMEKKITDLEEYLALIDQEKDSKQKEKASREVEEDSISLEKELDSLETKVYLSGKFDENDAILSIHAGQGGTEACDWAEMLMRMYLRYFEQKGWDAEITHILRGNEAGISSTTIEVCGRFAYGLLKGEHGTHRLVRISPFNAQGLRQTSFAGVEVMPVIENEDMDLEVEIKDEDIEFKAVRASGPGGQKVNKTSSAVQLKHIPTGIQVSASSLKSQHQNREAAMRLLRAKLYQIESEKKEEEVGRLKGEHKIAAWGNQIRNYILHPYKLVKDLRTGVEVKDPENVLDGDLDVFIDAGVRT